MKTKLLKNEEDTLFYAWTLVLFLFFSWIPCLTEVVSSWSNTYYYQSLSDGRRLFLALESISKILEKRLQRNLCFRKLFCIYEQSLWNTSGGVCDCIAPLLKCLTSISVNYLLETLWLFMWCKNKIMAK